MGKASDLTYDTMYCLLLLIELFLKSRITLNEFKECSELKITYLKERLKYANTASSGI